MDRIKLSFAAALAVGVFLAAPAAHGTILVPGQSGVAPDLFAFLPGATVVGSLSGSFTSVAFTGNYIEEVFVDPANGFGKNDLTWLIQVTNNNGSAGIGRITASSHMANPGHRQRPSQHRANHGFLFRWLYDGRRDQ
jgi:hypothetical protein